MVFGAWSTSDGQQMLYRAKECIRILLSDSHSEGPLALPQLSDVFFPVYREGLNTICALTKDLDSGLGFLSQRHIDFTSRGARR
jgi:hypothetical protein